MILGKLVGFVIGREWSTDLVDARLIWPEAASRTWSTRAVGHRSERQCPRRARRHRGRAGAGAGWAVGTIEEFSRPADVEFLSGLVSDFVALAVRAREHDESLYCWMCLWTGESVGSKA